MSCPWSVQRGHSDTVSRKQGPGGPCGLGSLWISLCPAGDTACTSPSTAHTAGLGQGILGPCDPPGVWPAELTHGCLGGLSEDGRPHALPGSALAHSRRVLPSDEAWPLPTRGPPYP